MRSLSIKKMHYMLLKRLEKGYSFSSLFAHKKFIFFPLFACLLLGIYQFSIYKIYGMIYYPDEFGYWANAANWLDYDWSSLTALGSYYSFGYSLILMPILKFSSNGLSAYRCAVAVNMLLQGLSMFPLYGIFRRMFPKLYEQTIVGVVGMAMFYPVWTFYCLSTLAEGLLFFLYIWIAYLFVRMTERPGMGTVLLLAAALIYIVFVHMRTIGVTAAAILVLLCFLWREPKYRKKIAVGFGALAVGMILGAAVRAAVLSTVYRNADSDMLAINDVAGQIRRILDICSPEGIVRFLCGYVAKVFYLGSATFGLFYFAIIYLWKKCCRLVRKLKYGSFINIQEWTSLFLLLSFTGQFLVSAVFMNRPGRVDEVLYGRYNDYMMPVLMGVGFAFIYGHRLRVKYILSVSLVHTAMLPVAIYAVKKYGGDLIQGYFIAGISYVMDDMNFDAGSELMKIFVLCIVLMLAMYLGIWLGRRFLIIVPIITLFISVEILLGMRLNYKYTYEFNDVIFEELEVSDYIGRSDESVPITYVYGGRNTYIETVQLYFPTRRIDVITEEDYIVDVSASGTDNAEAYKCTDHPSEYLILDIDSEYRAQIEQYYPPCVESGNFALYYLDEGDL